MGTAEEEDLAEGAGLFRAQAASVKGNLTSFPHNKPGRLFSRGVGGGDDNGVFGRVIKRCNLRCCWGAHLV